MRRVIAAIALPSLFAIGTLSLLSSCVTPAACRAVCEDEKSADCQSCLDSEREKAAERRRAREAQQGQGGGYPSGGMGGGGY
jgi:hypothetical protein